jgi:hypothetical protein
MEVGHLKFLLAQYPEDWAVMVAIEEDGHLNLVDFEITAGSPADEPVIIIPESE